MAAKPTKMVVHFDDGTSAEYTLAGMSSAFFNEAAAVKCGHRPPYGPPPSGGGGGVTTMEGGNCYYHQGVIVCP